MEGLLSIICLGSFVCMFLGYMVGFDHDFIASTRKKMLRLATVSLFALVSISVLAVTGVI